MTFRMFDTGTWVDPWFESLSSNAKLAFIYFWTNETCNQAGVYEISQNRIKFELGYPIDRVYSELSTKIVWYQDKNIVWVKNFFKRQCTSPKFATAAINSVKQDDFKLQIFIKYNRDILERLKIDLSRYPIDTLPIPYPTEQNRTDTEQIQNRTDKKLFSSEDDQVRLSKYLFAHIKKNNPSAKEPVFDSWANQFDSIMRIDKRSVDDIKAVIDWCQKDEFWKCNILSPKKLREKFDQLWIKMNTKGPEKDKEGWI